MRHLSSPLRRVFFISFICTISVSAQPTAVLDSLFGTAEVQRAGSVKWVPIERDARLLNNDVIRFAKGSFGIVRWPDNSQAYAYGGTQILINIGPENGKKILSYATVFMGSVFFVIKQILPQKFAEDIQIFTPTTVISIRGTSFLVCVEEKTGNSSIKMICGTVRVRCIQKNVAAFVSAPFKTVVGRKTTEIVTSAILSSDIDSLKQWVPEPVINFEISKQLAKSRRDRLIITETMYEKCTINSFTNNSTYKGDWDIRRIIPVILAKRIGNATNRLEIFAPDSSMLKRKSLKTPPRFTIEGTITSFDIVNLAEITVRADAYHERSIGRVSLQLILYDSHRPDEIDTIIVSGERSGKKNIENSWTTIDKFTPSYDDARFSSSLIGSALDQALETAAEKLIMKIYE